MPPECLAPSGARAGSFTSPGSCESARLADGVITIANRKGEPLVTHSLRAETEGRKAWIDGTIPIPGPQSVLVVHTSRGERHSLWLLSCNDRGCDVMTSLDGERIVVEATHPGALDYSEHVASESETSEQRYRLVFHDGNFARTPR